MDFLKKREVNPWKETPDSTKFPAAWAQVLKTNPRFVTAQVMSQTMAYGVPNESRLVVWTRLLGLGTYRPPERIDPPKELCDQIKCDIPRTFKGKFNPDKLYTVLTALTHESSLGTYCQGLNYLAVIFLEAAGEDERALDFSILGVEALVLKLQMKTYFYDHMRQLRADIIVLTDMLNLHIPYIVPLFEANDLELNFCVANWFLCLFSNIELEFPEVMRLWDYILCEGFGAVLRICMALLEYALPHPLCMTFDHDDIARRVKGGFKQHGVTATELLKIACSYELGQKCEISKIRREKLQEVGKRDAEIDLVNKLRRSGGRTRKTFW